MIHREQNSAIKANTITKLIWFALVALVLVPIAFELVCVIPEDELAVLAEIDLLV